MNLVIFPLHDWQKCKREGFRTRDAHLILEFEKAPDIEKILIIDRPVSIAEMLIKKKWWRVPTGKVLYKQARACLTQVSDKIFVLDILSYDLLRPLILRRRWWSHIFDRAFVIDAIKSAIARTKLGNFILFLWNPLSAGIIGKLEETMVVFDAVDNWLEHPQFKQAGKEVSIGYQKIRDKADLIFTVSEELKTVFGNSSNRVHPVPNGVDPEFFYIKEEVVPPDMKNIPMPIVGYAGKIQERIDIELIDYLSRELPNVSYVFIGQVLNNKVVKQLIRCKNVYYLGDKHYSLLPQYLNSFDICIIPHKVTSLTASMNPLKYYEYLAAGKPVVSTNVVGIKAIGGFVSIAETKETFSEHVKKYINMLDKKGRKSLSSQIKESIPPDFSWTDVAQKMVQQIGENWEKKIQ